MAALVFVAHAVATCALVGLIWLVQLVHYPLFAHVGAEAFPAFHQLHVRWISPVVVPPMLVELAGALYLVVDRPAFMPGWAAAAGLTLVVVAWGSTFALSVPAHDALARGFDPATIERLVTTNWVRTLAWTARAGLLSWLLVRALGR
jgi:hypothetical protein